MGKGLRKQAEIEEQTIGVGPGFAFSLLRGHLTNRCWGVFGKVTSGKKDSVGSMSG